MFSKAVDFEFHWFEEHKIKNKPGRDMKALTSKSESYDTLDS